MVYSEKVIKKVSIAAAIFGIVQGLIWMVGSILILLVQSKVIKYDHSKLLKPVENLTETILQSPHQNGSMLVDSLVSKIFLYEYLVLSLLWLIASIVVLYGCSLKNKKNFAISLIIWVILTILTSCSDFVLTVLLSLDIKTLDTKRVDRNKDIEIAYGVLALIICRGFIIWIINNVFAGCLIYIANQIWDDKIDNHRNNHLNNNYIDAYGNTNDGMQEKHNSYVNPAFVPEEDSDLKHQRELKEALKTFSPIESINDSNQSLHRTANIGKPGKNPPRNVSPPTFVRPPVIPKPKLLPKPLPPIPNGVRTPFGPYIPPPDYSPPTSPVPTLSNLHKRRY